MRLSTRGEYGLMAMVDLAMHSAEGPVQAQQIAERQGIPKQYLDQLMLALRKAGLVASSRGRQGGYALGRPASEIRLLDVVTALEGPVRNVNFLVKGRRRFTARAVLRGIWEDLWGRSMSLLRDTTVQDVCDQCRTSEQAPMYHI